MRAVIKNESVKGQAEVTDAVTKGQMNRALFIRNESIGYFLRIEHSLQIVFEGLSSTFSGSEESFHG